MNKIIAAALFVTCSAASVPLTAHSASIKLTFNYMATNQKGSFTSASGGAAVPVAELFLTDHADFGRANPYGGTGGVRATFKTLSDGLSQFSNGLGNVFISAFELNFPGTSVCADSPACVNTEDANGYDSDDNGGTSNLWQNVAGVPLTGGVEWAENVANNGWGSAPDDPAFGQEFNWGNAGGLNQGTGFSVIDLFSADGRDDLSVAALLANPVTNANAALPDALAWIKVRSNASAMAAERGIATDQWWGAPQTSGNGANQRWQLNVLALDGQRVRLSDVPGLPEPGTLPILTTGLATLLWLGLRRRNAGRRD